MKIIDLEQRSDAWHKYRIDHVMASDAPVFCGVSPYCTSFELWQRKMGLLPEIEINEHMQRGIDNEPKALAMLNERLNITFSPCVVESTINPIFAASLDGISDKNIICEIKCGASKAHQEAHRGELQVMYSYQIQHQLMVTGAAKCYFANYHDDDLAIIEVFPDEKIQMEIYEKGLSFYECIKNFTPPEMTDKDFLDVSNDYDINNEFKHYLNAKNLAKQWKESEELYKDTIVRLCGERSVKGKGWKMSRIVSRGKIDYSQVEKFHPEIIWDEYRKEKQVSYRITTT